MSYGENRHFRLKFEVAEYIFASAPYATIVLLYRVDEQLGGGRDVDVGLRWFRAKKVRRDTSETDLGRHVQQTVLCLPFIFTLSSFSG